MKTVDILISNYNSCIPGDDASAIELCLRSIRKHTRYPNYRIIVYDDYSHLMDWDRNENIRNEEEIQRLRRLKDEGLIDDLYENPGPKSHTHGGTLNKLVNEICQAEYAAILDCDIQILAPNWLSELIAIAERDPKIIMICDFKPHGIARRHYRTGLLLAWFCLLNMNAYNDGMRTDWMMNKASRLDEPYLSLFADMYPPEKIPDFHRIMQKDGIDPKEFDADMIHNDPGSKLWLKVQHDNPKNYKIIPVPAHIKIKYHHFSHLSMISVADPRHEKQVEIHREMRFQRVREELAKLRCNP